MWTDGQEHIKGTKSCISGICTAVSLGLEARIHRLSPGCGKLFLTRPHAGTAWLWGQKSKPSDVGWGGGKDRFESESRKIEATR